MRFFLLSSAAAASIFSLASASAATPTNTARAAPVESLAKCRQISDDARRLACYDAAAAALEAAEATGDIIVVDREQARSVRRQAFGFTLPSVSIFTRGESPEEIDTVTLAVKSARRGPDGKWRLLLEGDQVWRQVDTAELSRDPRAGGTVTIRKAMLGSYKLSSGGASSIRVHREN